MDRGEINFELIDVEEKIDEPALKSWLFSCIEEDGFEVGEINYYLCSDDYLLQMNKEHLNHDYYTDIITFDYRVGDMISGDLFISLDRVKDNSIEYSENYENEFLRVLIHGVLHIQGYGDKTEEEKSVMREEEQKRIEKYVSRETL